MNERTRILERLMSHILSEKYETGSRLPSERSLCLSFGTSRNTLRRALDVLEARGIVEIKRGSGTRILSTKGLENTGEGKKEGESIINTDAVKMEMRYLLAPVLVSHAMDYATPDRIEELQQNIVNLSQAIISSDVPSILRIEKECILNIISWWDDSVAIPLMKQIQPSKNMLNQLFSRINEEEMNELFAQLVELLNTIKRGDRERIELLITTRIIRLCELSSKYCGMELSPFMSDVLSRKDN